MRIITAKTAGFCFGVDRTVRVVAAELEKANRKVYTFGPVIHNKTVVDDFAGRGAVVVNDVSELYGVCDGVVIIRSHGVPPGILEEIRRLPVDVLDCTCPFVEKIRKIVSEAYKAGKRIIIVGDKKHPEVDGVNGCAGYEAVCVDSVSGLSALDPDAEYVMVVQTTFDLGLFFEIAEAVKAKGIKAEIHGTICEATAARQKEADKLSKSVDLMVVLGDKSSSNSRKLYEICKKNLENTFFVESVTENIAEIQEKMLNISPRFDIIIGVTAGASTPPAIIKEAINAMSDINQSPEQNFETMIADSNVVLRTGETVRGTVLKINNGEVVVDLKFKSDGIIQKGEYSDNPDADPAKELKIGDFVDVYVMRVNDGEGNVLLSKKRADGRKHMLDIEEAHKTGTPLPGKIIEIVKGGCIALIKGVRTFVPSSQVASRFVPDLKAFLGQEMNFNIIEFDKNKRRIVAGRRDLAAKEIQEKKDRVFDSVKIGDKLTGTVSRIAQFGAFIDLGGVDGLVHISELSWGRIRRVTDVLKEGDTVTVAVIDMDREKGKISLSLRGVNDDPWMDIEERYPIGALVDGRVARIASFGAFIELEDGVDGLVHISQVASRHIERVEEELQIGQFIKVKVTAVNKDSKRVSLSKKAADNELPFEYLSDDDYDDYDETADDYVDEEQSGEQSEEQSEEQGSEA